MATEMSPKERTQTIAGLFNQMLRTLPSASSALTLSPQEIVMREAAGRDLGDRIHELATEVSNGDNQPADA